MRKVLLFLGVSLVMIPPALAGEVDVIDVKMQKQGSSYRFDVTLKHDDTGWDHYANRWEVLSPDGTILATRVLAHPHVNEQPFTRSLSGVEVPKGISTVEIRGHDSMHFYGGKTLLIDDEPVVTPIK